MAVPGGAGRRTRRYLLLLTCALVIGCAERAQPRDSNEPPNANGTGASSPVEENNGQGEDTILIEGMPEVIGVHSIRSPAGFPLAFTTLVPGDMETDFISTGESDAIRFEAAFAGIPREDAALLFIVPLVTADSAATGRWVAEVALEQGAVRLPEPNHSWAVEEYRLQGEAIGFIALGEHADRWFYFRASYPPEFADGMGPRLDLIFRRWRWADDGAPLIDH